MATRKDQFANRPNAVGQGFEGSDSPGDYEIPSCTVEDVDRSVFNLFDKHLPLQAKEAGEGNKKIPVIFATGERFAVLRRKEPLRDKAGALILPLVSIMRTGMTQAVDHGMGPGQGGPITITKRISKESQIYNKLVNLQGISNQDSLASDAAVANTSNKGEGTEPGRVATRQDGSAANQSDRKGQLLAPRIGKNIYETLTIPPVKFYTATYDITFWSQYTQEMNDMLMTVMSLDQNNHQRTFKLETDKGYWFVGFVDSDLASGNNSDDFTDDERLIRYSFSIKVGAYVLAPEYPGSPAYIRRTVSAPQISFSTISPTGDFNLPSTHWGAPTRNDPDSHILKDLYSEFDPIPAVGVGQSPQAAVKQAINSIGGELGPTGQAASAASGGSSGASAGGSAMIGGKESSNANKSTDIITTEIDPFTGKKVKKVLRIKSSNQRKGETVLKEEGMIDLGDLFRVK